MREIYDRAVLGFGVIAIALGVALVVRTAQAGGGIGYIFGALFVAVGAGRIYLMRKR